MTGQSAAEAIDAAEFAAAIARLGPFEPAPHFAVAVSGGPDSMALTLLAADWVKTLGGSITAITVDHRLRAGAAQEAQQVGGWLHDYGIVHTVLTRSGPVPPGDIQAAARAARYALLRRWCRDHGVLHLLTAHHRDDQAETLLLRLGRGSGLNGLAAMPALSEDGACRLLRPLLGFPRDRLLATLEARQQLSLQDPSNRDPKFSRVCLRQAMPDLSSFGLTSDRLAGTAWHLGQSRAALEQASERLLAGSVTIDPAGFALVDPVRLQQAPPELRGRALAAVICTVGSNTYPPRFDRLETLLAALAAGGDFKPCTLGGCRIMRHGTALLIFRELQAAEGPIALTGRRFRWDRFDGVLPPAISLDDLTVGPLGLKNLLTFQVKSLEATMAARIPKKTWAVLPALRREDRILAVPNLGWKDAGLLDTLEMRFRPERPLTTAGFFVV